MKINGYDGLWDWMDTQIWYYTVLPFRMMICRVLGHSTVVHLKDHKGNTIDKYCSRCSHSFGKDYKICECVRCPECGEFAEGI